VETAAAQRRLVTAGAGTLILVGALAYALYRQGAYYESQHHIFGVLIIGAGVISVIDRTARSALVSMAIVIAPLLISSAISTAFAGDRSDVASTFLTISLTGIALAIGASLPFEHRSQAIHATVLVSMIVAVTAIWGVAHHSVPWGRVTEGVWRGSSSITYANAAAGVVGPMAVLTFCIAAIRGGRGYAVATTLLLTAFAATQSRAGALTLVIVALVTVAYLGIERFARTAVPVVLGTLVASVPLVLSAPDSARPQPLLVFLAIALGLVITAGAFTYRDAIPRPGIGLGIIVAFGAIALATTSLGEALRERLTIRSGTTAGGQDASVVFGDRAKEWSTAWERVTDSPIVGHGPGAVDLTWTENGRTFQALFVHNEYLELAVTHGVLGLAALVVSGWLLVRRRDRSDLTVPVTLAVGAFLVHSAFDFFWHVPVLPVVFAFLAGLVMSVGPIHERSHAIALEPVGQ